MSIVVNVLTPSCSWVAFDGRAQCEGKITTEFQRKAIMVNKNVCLGYTGTLEFAQQVIQNLEKHTVGVSEMKSDTIAYKQGKIMLNKISVLTLTSTYALSSLYPLELSDGLSH